MPRTGPSRGFPPGGASVAPRAGNLRRFAALAIALALGGGPRGAAPRAAGRVRLVLVLVVGDERGERAGEQECVRRGEADLDVETREGCRVRRAERERLELELALAVLDDDRADRRERTGARRILESHVQHRAVRQRKIFDLDLELVLDHAVLELAL